MNVVDEETGGFLPSAAKNFDAEVLAGIGGEVLGEGPPHAPRDIGARKRGVNRSRRGDHPGDRGVVAGKLA